MNQREIARLAGVSTATVSRVINNDRRVTEQTRKRVQQAIDENGYVQNMNARNLRVSHSHAIGFLISNQLIGELLERQESATLDTTLPKVQKTPPPPPPSEPSAP